LRLLDDEKILPRSGDSDSNDAEDLADFEDGPGAKENPINVDPDEIELNCSGSDYSAHNPRHDTKNYLFAQQASECGMSFAEQGADYSAIDPTEYLHFD
jgi:hypothetical protein